MNWLNLRILRLLLLPVVILSATAGAAEVRAYIQPPTARPNQTVSYVIVIQNGNLTALPNLRFPLQVLQTSGPSVSNQRIFQNGKQSASVQLAWGIMASEPGEFIIPPQDVMVDGQTLKTPEVKFNVAQGGDDPAQAGSESGHDPILQLELGKKEIYVGEVVPLTCTLFVPRETPLRRLGLIDIEKNDFAIARFPQQSEQGGTVIGDVGYQVLTFRSTLSALHAGDLQVGPAKMEILVEVPMDRQAVPRTMPGFPQFFFGGASEPRKVIVQSPPVHLKVLGLPGEGKPANFSGAVGDFTMDVSATPSELTVGDPLSVELILAGSGNFDALATPELTSAGGWRLYPAKRYNIEGNLDQNMTPTVERKIGFSQVLVPEAVAKELPPFEVSYFSPTQRKYVTLRTQSMPLTIRPAAATPPAPTAESNAPGSQAANAPPSATKPQAQISDILIKPAAKAHWLGAPALPLWQRRSFWALQVVPVALLLFAALGAWLRSRGEKRRAGLAGELRAAWAEVESSDASDGEFLRRAAQLIVKSHAGRPVTDPELRGIMKRYESANFSAGSDNGLTHADRKRMLGALAPLARTVIATLLVMLAGVGAACGADAKPASSPDEAYRQAVQEIEKGNFTKAQYLAESLTKKQPPQLSPELFELIGHTRYRQDDLGRAALWYERAELLNPRSPELRQNLRYLRDRLGFLEFSPESPLVEWSYWLGPNEWALLTAAGVWLFLLAIAWLIVAGRRSVGLVVALCVIGFLVAVPSATFAAIRKPGPERVKDIGVIVLPEIQAFTAATVTSGSIIELPPGSQVRILEKRGAWVYVEIPNRPENLRGWVEVPAIAPLWPWDSQLLP